MGFSAPDPVPALRPATVVASVESPIPAFVALYDDEGVLRCVGGDQAACLAYAQLFALDPESCSLVSLN